MSFAIGQPVLWPMPADWGKSVTESLAWLTDALPSRDDGTTQKRELRQAPRRSFGFDVIVDGRDRRLLDSLRFDNGSREWRLPIWPDGQVIAEAVASSASVIACSTAGRDFVVGGQAAIWTAVDQWELVDIASIEAEGLTLASDTVSAWPVGARLWPVRRAVIPASSEESTWHDDASRIPMQFRITEPCDWQGAMPSPIYRGLPVLDVRPDQTDTTEHSYVRDQQLLDDETGVVQVIDYPNRPARGQAHAWRLFGREEHTHFRDLMYGLRGRMGELWVPSWNSDLKVVANIGSSATAITVEYLGYTVFGRQQNGRRDIRIELVNGTVFYRRITASIEAGGFEVLTINAALGVAVPFASIRSVSFMAPCQMASDQVELEHVTDADGYGRSTTRWEGTRRDV